MGIRPINLLDLNINELRTIETKANRGFNFYLSPEYTTKHTPSSEGNCLQIGDVTQLY